MLRKKYKSRRFIIPILSSFLVNVLDRMAWRYLYSGHPKADAF